MNSVETGTTSYLDRMQLTRRIDEALVPFLREHGFRVCEFGQDVILKSNSSLRHLVRKLEAKKSKEALMIKFWPDFICYQQGNPKSLFLLDTKASITPVFFGAHIERLRNASGSKTLEREDIGEIEREAWDVYTSCFPSKKVAICFACPYHPRLLVVEWASELKSLYRFALDTNTEAGGSQTPHVNIHLGHMRSLEQFLGEDFGVKVQAPDYKLMTDMIKEWPLNKPRGRVNWAQFNNVVTSLRRNCPWIQYRNLRAGDDREQLRLFEDQ